ncbi:glycoside hydrolase family 15 protein [Rothia sp. AR01]|uniref:Glycoside hydrolase family 15 protein n=1 Tax=Rothia santali TaxID=2949643 RepID=A0A9X2HC60_9MICC|nr:glycoside hydrolase family 15 protein [Rothia santali]MCP3426651.1 glycoside hydrolase family 15 protein [Rothia santali]
MAEKNRTADRAAAGEHALDAGTEDAAPASPSTPLEEYALLSDLATGALVSRDGSIDWLCLPRFDAPAMFSAILGGPEDGRWKLSAVGGRVVGRRYRSDSFILETLWRTETGRLRVTDFLPPKDGQSDLIRRVECLEGSVEVEHDLRLRFNYARSLPWFRRVPCPGGGDLDALLCNAGPDGVLISGPMLCATTEPTSDDAPHHAGGDGITTREYDLTHEGTHVLPDGATGTIDPDASGSLAPRLAGRFSLEAGETLDWNLTWFPSWAETPAPTDPDRALRATERYWSKWARKLQVNSPEGHLVMRSLLVLKALTHTDTGGIVAAPTASLPEHFGGERNWDYRYTWLRDAALTVEVIVAHGHAEGALHWRDWLLRAVAGDADRLRIMYGLGGERDLDEKELPHLAGYEGSRPVRVGNAAAEQYQADVVGEVMLALAELRDGGHEETEFSWGLQKALLDYTIANFDKKDHGIWEMRGDQHYFTHGRVMMWASFNEALRAVEEHGLDGDTERWEEYRERLREEIMEHGFDEELDSFTQTYDGREVDASLLQLPHTRFIEADDPRMLGTVARIERDLVDEHGLVHRYRTETGMDGLGGPEYPFLICAFWLVEQYANSGRVEDAHRLMNQLCSYASDTGLLAEEYDPESGRLAGNFPQAFSHLSLIRAADALQRARGNRV